MANRTDKRAMHIHGKNPQLLVAKIVRSKVYESYYWKQHCFGLTAESLVDKAVELQYVGGTYGGSRRAAPFLCLLMKMLQIQPDKDVVMEYIHQDEFKYLRALGSFYLRLIGDAAEIYKCLEPMLADYRKLRVRQLEGKVVLSHVDEFIFDCLTKSNLLDIDLPVLQNRGWRPPPYRNYELQ